MKKATTKRVVAEFTRAICDNDVAAMSALMSDDHAFIDSYERRLEGRDACVRGWRTWFESHPGFCQEIESIVVRDDQAYLAGSIASHEGELVDHVLWRARCRNGQIAEWQIYHAGGEEGLFFPPGMV